MIQDDTLPRAIREIVKNDRRSDSIRLPPRSAFDSASAFYGVALHETAHASGHEKRLNRETLNESYHFGDLAYAKEELRAELASIFLLAEPASAASTSGFLQTALSKVLRNNIVPESEHYLPEHFR